MAEVFSRKDSVFFIGGTGTKAGIATPGGCTRAFYEAKVTANGSFALTDIMGANGGAFFTEDGVETTNTGVTTVTASADMEAAGVAVGMCVFCIGNGFTDGIYEILSVSANVFTIHIDALGTPGPGGLGNIFVGGAFATVQQALDDTTGALGFNTWVLINKADDAVGRTMASMGNLALNSHWYLWGFNTTPPTNLFEPTGDQDFGGAAYKSALDILNQGGLSYHTLGGTELVTNGGFDTDSAWTLGNAVIAGGVATITIPIGDAFSFINQLISYTPGSTYRVTLSVIGDVGNQFRIQDHGSDSGGLRLVDTLTTLTGNSQQLRFTWVANSNSVEIIIARQTGGTPEWSFNIDNVSIKEVLIPAKVKLSMDTTGDLITIAAGENIHFRNLDLQGHVDYDIFNLSGVAEGVVVQGCAITTYDDLIGGSSSNSMTLDDCYIGEPAANVDVNTGFGSTMTHCIFDLKTKGGINGTFWNLESCIFIGGTQAISWADEQKTRNCVFYNQTSSCVFTGVAGNFGGFINNIFIPAAAANVIDISAGGGSVGLFAHNIMWGADGNQVSTPFDNNGTPFTPFGPGNIEEDPQFVSVTPGSYDFRSRNPRVLRGGQQTINGDPTQMGAVLQKHQFDLRNIS